MKFQDFAYINTKKGDFHNTEVVDTDIGNTSSFYLEEINQIQKCLSNKNLILPNTNFL